jgi:chromosome segregation ATPase
MLKKILIAATAVVVGLVLINKSSLVRVWWKDAKACVENHIPIDTQLKQLRVEIDAIDNDIKKNLSQLADQEVKCKMTEERLAKMKARQQQLRADISDMEKGLEARTARVSFKDTSYSAAELTRKLDRSVADYKNLKDQVKHNEALLADQKRTVEAAHNRLTAMRNQKEELRTLHAKLQTQYEVVKQKQMEGRLEVDDSQVTRARELAHKIEVRMRKMETEARLQADYGYAVPASEVDKPVKTAEEVRKEARQALADDKEQPEKVAADK